MKKEKKAVAGKPARKKAAGPATKPGRTNAAPARDVEPSPRPTPMPKSKIDAKHRKEFRTMLLRLRERLAGQIAALKNDSLNRDDNIDLAEDGTDAFERQFALSLVSSENDSVLEIDEALKKMDDGTYGLCEQCSQPISDPRLKALPFVKLCVGCQSAVEKNKPKYRPMQDGIPQEM